MATELLTAAANRSNANTSSEIHKSQPQAARVANLVSAQEPADLTVEVPWSATPVEVAAQLDVNLVEGLDQQEAQRRLDRFGANSLPEPPRKSKLRQFLAQFADWMIALLGVAALISAVTGEWQDSALIVLILFINAIIGFVQGQRAEMAVAALKKLSHPTARVRREGSVRLLGSEQLVPGDVIELVSGAIAPADVRVVEASELQVEEAALTGESMPVDKQVEPVATDAPLAERASMVHAGTTIAHGRGFAIVTATGSSTEIGTIAGMIDSAEEVATPLQRRLASLSRWLAVIVVVVCCAVFWAGMARNIPASASFLLAVSLAVAAVPEGLPAVITIALALGSQRMSRRRAIVRQLSAVETLGSVDVICSDKTGTLTQNKMVVSDVVPHRDDAGLRQKLLRAAVLCNDAHLDDAGKAFGSATEVALLHAGQAGGMDVKGTRSDWRRIAEYAFSSMRKRMSSIHRAPSGTLTVFVKGAPEAVLSRVTHLAESDGDREIGSDDRQRLERIHSDLAVEGKRVLALARRSWDANVAHGSADDVESELALLGFIGITDAPRPEAKDAIARCHSAGIRVVMITGDHQSTATTIAKDLGLLVEGTRIISGQEIDQLDDQALEKVAPATSVYARVTPSHKLRIVRAYQSGGDVVAMTGDGINDAPALKQADIGVAMGITGTDVSKEAARIILADDNFATIVAAVEEGRAVYDNIRKFVAYLLTTNASELLLILAAIIAGLPVPLLPIHLFWINLVTDGPPALALAFEPGEPGIMRRKPRRRADGIFSGGVGRDIVLYGALLAATCFGVYAWFLYQSQVPTGTNREVYARTAVFIAVALSQLFCVLAFRSSEQYVLEEPFWSNWRLAAALIVGSALQLAVVYIPYLQHAFHTVALRPVDLGVVVCASLLPLIIRELQKLVTHRITRKSSVAQASRL